MYNVSMHKKLPQYTNIQVDYFPQNTKSATQPLDQGIIKVVKDRYHAILTNYLHAEFHRAIEEGREFTVVDTLKRLSVT
jgi:hypothetical protein